MGLAWGDFAAVWQPFPDAAPGRQLIAYAVGGLFLAAGALTLWSRTSGLGSALIASLSFMFALFWLAMRVLAHPQVMALYNGVAEQLAIAMGGVAVFAAGAASQWSRTLGDAARLVFGACCLTFATAHFVYTAETAAMVPSWIPPDGRTWAQITGAAHAAAGLALLSGVGALLAARLLTAMFVAFGVLVWAPMLAGAPDEHMNWAGNAINLMLVGAAWAIGDEIARRRG